MRRMFPDQLVLVPAFHSHPHARELHAMSRILDEHPETAKWVHDDLIGREGRQVSAKRGREGMSAEQVLRALVVKQLGGFSYDELAFQLADSNSYRAFCRFEVGGTTPTKKTLQRNIKKVEALTLERINVVLVEHALGAEIDDGNKIRVDCTVVETNIHEPADSSLLLDSVRVLVRLIGRAQEYVDAPFTEHHRRAKRRALGILHARTQEDRVPLYLDLLKVTNKTVTAAERVIAAFTSKYSPEELKHPQILGLVESLQHYVALARRVISQTHRRIALGETVPASEKLVSIFETHTGSWRRSPRESLPCRVTPSAARFASLRTPHFMTTPDELWSSRALVPIGITMANPAFASVGLPVAAHLVDSHSVPPCVFLVGGSAPPTVLLSSFEAVRTFKPGFGTPKLLRGGLR